MHLPDRERGHVIRGHVVHELHRLRAADHELAHVRHIKKTTCFAHRVVLGGNALRVLHRHFIAGERDDLCPEPFVDVVERGAFERTSDSHIEGKSRPLSDEKAGGGCEGTEAEWRNMSPL